MASVFDHLKKLKVIIEFKGRKFIFEVPPYKTIQYIKDHAKNHFFLFKDNIILIYQNKPMTNYEQNLIGDYFKNRLTIPFKLMQIEDIPLRESHSNDFTYPQKCTCDEGNVEFYCRICKQYICSKCKGTEKHNKHLVIQIDTESPIDNVKIYAMTLQKEINANIKATINSSHQFRNNNLIEVNARQEMFLRKLQKVHILYKEMMTELTSIKGEDNKVNSMIVDFQLKAKQAKVDIDSLISSINQQYKKGKIKMSYEEMKGVFEEINQRERMFEGDSCNAIAYKLNYEVNTSLDNMYEGLEKLVDEYLNKKTLLGLNAKNMHTYEVIKSQRKTLNGEMTRPYSELKLVSMDGIQIKEKEKEQEKGEYNHMATSKEKNELPLLLQNNVLRKSNSPSHYYNLGVKAIEFK